MYPLDQPPETATGMSMFRQCQNGDVRQYSAVAFRHGNKGVERTLRRFTTFGWITNNIELKDVYGILDLIDNNGDIIGDRLIPNSKAFQGIKRHLKLTVEDTEPEV